MAGLLLAMGCALGWHGRWLRAGYLLLLPPGGVDWRRSAQQAMMMMSICGLAYAVENILLVFCDTADAGRGPRYCFHICSVSMLN